MFWLGGGVGWRIDGKVGLLLVSVDDDDDENGCCNFEKKDIFINFIQSPKSTRSCKGTRDLPTT